MDPQTLETISAIIKFSVEISIYRSENYVQGIKFPSKAYEYDTGYDLQANIPKPIIIEPGERILIDTGIGIKSLPCIDAQIRPRSGLALNHGVTVLNAPATIDPNYTGIIKVLLINLGKEPFILKPLMRIAQLTFGVSLNTILTTTDSAFFETMVETKDGFRGNQGFGSSGEK